MKKEAYYFSHDANSRNDLKCVKLRQELGMEGYGIFWAIIEILRESDSYRLKISDLETISFDLKCKLDTVKSVVNNYGLFKISGGMFSSKRLTQSMFEYNKRKQILSESGKRGNAVRWRSGGDGQVIALKERKGKERKKGISPSGDGNTTDNLDHNGHPKKPLDGMVW